MSTRSYVCSVFPFGCSKALLYAFLETPTRISPFSTRTDPSSVKKTRNPNRKRTSMPKSFGTGPNSRRKTSFSRELSKSNGADGSCEN